MSNSTTLIHQWLLLCHEGDSKARDELFLVTQGRLKAIVRKCFAGSFVSLRDRMDSDDGLQDLQQRLLEQWESILSHAVTAPNPVRSFFGLAATTIRDILCEAMRKKVGQGQRPRPQFLPLKNPHDSESSPGVDIDPGDTTSLPDKLAVWTEVHEFFATLPDPLSQVADLRWYHGLTHPDVGECLGITEKVARTHWARIRHLFLKRFPTLEIDWAV
jgi:DNA-directed RNA polymerase specialized sigma24 family protein